MCQRFIMDPSVRDDEEVAEWSGLRSWIFLLQGNLPQAECQALGHKDHWISMAILKHLGSAGVGDREATHIAWSRVSERIEESVRPKKRSPKDEDRPFIELAERGYAPPILET